MTDLGVIGPGTIGEPMARDRLGMRHRVSMHDIGRAAMSARAALRLKGTT